LEEIKRGLTARAILIGLIISIIMLVPIIWWMHFQWARFAWRRISPLGLIFTLTLELSVLVSLLQIISKKVRFSPQELTVIYAMLTSMIGIPWIFGFSQFSVIYTVAFSRHVHMLDHIPDFWMPKDKSIVENLWLGNIPFNFSAWAPSIAAWSIAYILYYFYAYSIGLILRRAYIDVEKLPYPLTTPITWMITQTTKSVEEREGKFRPSLLSRKASLFWIAFFIGLFWNWYYSPTGGGGQGWGLNVLLGWPDPEPYMQYTYLSGKLPYPFTNMLIAWDIDAFGLGLYFLFPLEVLLTGIIFYIISYMIWPVIMVVTNIARATPGIGEWGAYGLAGYTPPYLPAVIADESVWIGMGLMGLIVARKEIVASFKSFLKGSREGLEAEPISHRATWLILIITFIGLSAFLSVSGANVILAISTVIFLGFVNVSLARIRGEAWPGYSNAWGVHQGRYLENWIIAVGQATGSLPGYGVSMSPEQVRNLYVVTAFGSPNYWTGYWSPIIPCLETLKVAQETRTKPRDIFLAIIPTVIIAIILTYTFLSVNLSMFGVGNFARDWWTGWEFAWMTDTAASGTLSPYGGEQWPWFIGYNIFGVILTMAMLYARTIWPWFPLHPLGFLLVSVSFYGFLYVLIAYIVKLAVLKIGGTEFYQNKALPFALGLLVGGYTGFYPMRCYTLLFLGR